MKANTCGSLKASLKPASVKASFHSTGKGYQSTSELEDRALRMDVVWHDVAGRQHTRLSKLVESKVVSVLLVAVLIVLPATTARGVLLPRTSKRRPDAADLFAKRKATLQEHK